MEGDSETLLDRFARENMQDFKVEVGDILVRLREIGKKHGAREEFFKVREGKLGDGVCALYDNPKSNLRLYCIRFGAVAIIVGSGGYKPKTIRALQEDPILNRENQLVVDIGKYITKARNEGIIEFNGFEFEGTLTIDTDDL